MSFQFRFRVWNHYTHVAVWGRVLSCKRYHLHDLTVTNCGHIRGIRRLSRTSYWLTAPRRNALTTVMLLLMGGRGELWKEPFIAPYPFITPWCCMNRLAEKFWKQISKFTRDREERNAHVSANQAVYFRKERGFTLLIGITLYM